MLTNNFEVNVENADTTDNASVGDHLVREGYASAGDKAIMDILENNQKLVDTYSNKICEHFSGVLAKLPESMQAAYIDSIRMYNDDPKNVVYNGMINRFDSRVATV